MIDIISNLIGSCCMMICSLYIWGKLYNKKFGFNDYKNYLYIIVSIVLILLNYFYNFAFVRILIITSILTIINKLVYKNNFKCSIISSIISQFIICFSDLIFGLIIIFVFNVDVSLVSSFYGVLFANVFALVVSMLIINIKFISRFYDKLISLIDNMRYKKIIIFAILIIISLNLLLVFIYYKLNLIFIVVCNISLIVIYSLVIIKNLETSSINDMIKSENKSLIENLSEFEAMLDRQRIDNHENKNQLLIIKNMIKKNDLEVIKYIDTIIVDQKEDDEVLYTKVKNIPSGGLQGIIYQKMLLMKDLNILFSLDVSRDLRRVELNNLSVENNYKLCKILGVFLDNAIDECKNIDDKKIIISLYLDNGFLVIEVSNKYKGVIDMDSLDKEGFTTKSNGHGYGLCLVKKIIACSDIFVNNREINNGYFKQIIKVKI